MSPTRPLKAGPPKHFPEETTLSLPHTPSLDRIVRQSNTFAELAAKFHGMRDWTEEDKEAVRAFNAVSERIWERRRLEIAAQRQASDPTTSTASTASADIRQHPDDLGPIEGRHYSKKRQGGRR